VQHHIVPVGEAELADNLEQAVYHAEHHNQNLNFVGKFLLWRMVHAHGYQVMLTGEGGTARALSAYQLAPECWHPCLPEPHPLETLAAGLSPPAKWTMKHKWHPLHSALYAWTKTHLANSILSCLGDRTEMAHLLEARTPFLDHPLTSYVNGLPPGVKLRHEPSTDTFIEKWVLREAARPFVLPELYARQ
jgi:asparagine synthase (glutamine-hydrolysing)